MDFSPSNKAKRLISQVQEFIAQRILPGEATYYQQLGPDGPDWKSWQVPPIMREWKSAAEAAGLWNLFLPDEKWGAGLNIRDYAYLAELMGRSALAPEVFNCNPPDTGNMEVLARFGTPAQQERWLLPLLAGKIRSVFFMTEPAVASSDATNISATVSIGTDEIILNGRKWWSSGAGHPQAKIGIFLGRSNPEAPRHEQHSMVLVPLDSPGLKIERMLPVFHHYEAPYGHGEVSFTEVRVPRENLLVGPGQGFAIAQGRLGPGRIHHCMRCIGAAERALELLCSRAQSRVAFGEPLVDLGANREHIAEARLQIEMTRLLCLKAAWMMDTVGVKAARSEISQIKVAAPRLALQILDQAMQIHGGAGMSQDLPLASLYSSIRTLRLADGPDEVHKALIARLELKSQEQKATAASRGGSHA